MCSLKLDKVVDAVRVYNGEGGAAKCINIV